MGQTTRRTRAQRKALEKSLNRGGAAKRQDSAASALMGLAKKANKWGKKAPPPPAPPQPAEKPAKKKSMAKGGWRKPSYSAKVLSRKR